MGNGKLWLHRIQALQRIAKKTVKVDYVREIYVCQFMGKSFHGGFWANGWNVTYEFLYIYLFLTLATDFDTQ